MAGGPPRPYLRAHGRSALRPPASRAPAASAAWSPARACAGPARRPPTGALARARRGRDRRARRRAGPRARQAARAHARRRDEDRPGALDRRLHARSRPASARSSSRRSPRCATTSRRSPSPRSSGCAHRARRAGLAATSPSSTRTRSPPRRSARSTARSRATATRSPSRSSTRAWPRRSRPTCATSGCCCRWSSGSRPGSTVKALAAELRERVAEELDYEIEAQNHRHGRARWRGPPVRARPGRRHVAVQPPRARHRAAVRPPLRGGQARSREAERDRFAEIVFRFFFGTLSTSAAPPATRIPATTCCSTTAASGSSTSGSCAIVDPAYLEGERELARAVDRRRRRRRARQAWPRSATCPDPAAFDPRGCSSSCGWPASGTSSPARAASRPPT